MANWYKRSSKKSGNSGQRTTRTTNNKGNSVYSFSKKVGNTRTTQSTSSKSGKTRIITTETHPTLGRKVTVKTLNPTPKVKRQKKRRLKKTNYRSDSNHYVPMGMLRDTSWDGAIYVAFLAVLALILFGLFSSGHWIMGSTILALYIYYEYL